MAGAQALRINEVQPANQRTVTGQGGGHPDWVELYNSGSAPVDLAGHVLSTGLHHHRINGPLPVPPQGHQLLWFDGRSNEGPTHVPMRLPRAGGTLLLIAPDGATVLDLFTWPSLPADAAMGRCPDGAATWGLFEQASPGSANPAEARARRVLAAPTVLEREGAVHVPADGGTVVRYTIDGTPVPGDGPAFSTLPVMDGPIALRLRASAPDALPSAEVLHTVDPPASAWISVAADPADLWDPERGIIGDSTHANYAQGDRIAPCLVEFGLKDARTVRPLGLAVAGSGTRSAPKRSFKLNARDRFGGDEPIALRGLGAWNEVMLRADATPHAFLRNTFVEAVVQRAGLRVDAPRSLPCRLLLNGRDQGLYRILPPKNGAWVRTLHGTADIDLADGPGGTMLRGDRGHLDRSLKALAEGAPWAVLDSLIDTGSLIDLACLDAYTGRADHDLNVRCWRPRTPGGRWRWMVFDMDLWAPPEENSIERMCTASTLEAPYLPRLLQGDALTERFVARLEALMLTVLSPASAEMLIDSLHDRYADMLRQDAERWRTEMPRPSPEETTAGLRMHARARPTNLVHMLARQLHRPTTALTIEVPAASQGTISVEELAMAAGRTRATLVAGIPMRFTAVPAPGMVFLGWGVDDAHDPVLTVEPGRERRLRPVFGKAGSGDDGLQQ
jgi:hypothetical protein